MASDRQIAANRANAANSSGPKTTTGKKKSSRNGLRNGLLASAVVLEGESLHRFAILFSELEDQFQPRNSVELSLVENMAAARWRMMRLWAIQKSRIALEIKRQESAPDASETITYDAPTRAAIAFDTLHGNGHSLQLINRYEASYERQYNSALDRLVKMRQKSALLPSEPNLDGTTY